MRFVSSEQAHSDYENEHWKLISKTCRVCELNVYDTIVQTEHSNADASAFLKSIGKEYIGSFPSSMHHHGKVAVINQAAVTPTENVHQHFIDVQNFWKQNIPSELTRAVYEKYYWDFELFGYSLDGFI